MATMPTTTKDFRKVEDIGLDGGLDKLTPERIRTVINEVLKGEASARMNAYLESCVRCGMCAKACHFSLSHAPDPTYSPVSKTMQTIKVMLDKKGDVDVQTVRNMAQLAHTECNLCRRCVQYCPFGIDTGYMMSLVRRIAHKLGLTPQNMQDTCHSHATTFNQMWVKEDEWLDALFWQEDEARDEFPDLHIPVNKVGADFMYSVIAPEAKFRTQLIYQAAAILHTAGVDWTMPMEPGWDNSDMAMMSGDTELMGRLKRMHFKSAANLRVKRIVMGECGHAFRSVYDVGNRWLGYKFPPFQITHAVEFYHEMLTTGKIKVASKVQEPVTLHDPCNIARGRGLFDKAREIAHAFCDNVIEMYPNREHNICCAAGGGVINCGPPFKKTRNEGNSIKAEQLKATGAKIVIAPCHNCHGGLDDVIHHYDLGMELKFFGDIIYEHMEKPDAAL